MKTAFRLLLYFTRYIRNRVGRVFEATRFAFCIPEKKQLFFFACCSRNAGAAAIKCLTSIHEQRYDRTRFEAVYVDDASTDNTAQLIRDWLRQHPDSNVRFIQNAERRGGTANTVHAFSMAPAGSIVIELNGDDWLADRHVLEFLNKVYADDDVWITYNTSKYPNRRPKIFHRSVAKRVINSNAFRNSPWCSGQPRTFRRELLSYLREDTWTDPLTNDYWASADDQAFFLAMLERAGRHSRHLFRISYVYNYRAESDDRIDPRRSLDCMRRIRLQEKYEPLESLDCGRLPATGNASLERVSAEILMEDDRQKGLSSTRVKPNR